MQGSEQTPKAPLGNNARPVQNLHHRTVRTNIDFKQSKVRQTQTTINNLMHFNIYQIIWSKGKMSIKGNNAIYRAQE